MKKIIITLFLFFSLINTTHAENYVSNKNFYFHKIVRFNSNDHVIDGGLTGKCTFWYKLLNTDLVFNEPSYNGWFRLSNEIKTLETKDTFQTVCGHSGYRGYTGLLFITIDKNTGELYSKSSYYSTNLLGQEKIHALGDNGLYVYFPDEKKRYNYNLGINPDGPNNDPGIKESNWIAPTYDERLEKFFDEQNKTMYGIEGVNFYLGDFNGETKIVYYTNAYVDDKFVFALKTRDSEYLNPTDTKLLFYRFLNVNGGIYLSLGYENNTYTTIDLGSENKIFPGRYALSYNNNTNKGVFYKEGSLNFSIRNGSFDLPVVTAYSVLDNKLAKYYERDWKLYSDTDTEFESHSISIDEPSTGSGTNSGSGTNNNNTSNISNSIDNLTNSLQTLFGNSIGSGGLNNIADLSPVNTDGLNQLGTTGDGIITQNQGTINLPIKTDGDNCSMFNKNTLVFQYYSNGTVGINFSFQEFEILNNSFGWFIDKMAGVTIGPINSVIGITALITPFTEDREYCLFGKVKKIEHHLLFKNSELYNEFTIIDYIVLFAVFLITSRHFSLFKPKEDKVEKNEDEKK